MPDANLGTAVLRTKLDNTGLTAGLTTAEQTTRRTVGNMDRSIQALGRQWTSLGRTLSLGITAPIIAAGAAAVASAVKLGQYADRMLDLEQITGLSVTTLQEFENVARLAGVSTSVFNTAAEGLQRRLRAAGNESAEFQANIQALGVDTRTATGALRDVDDLMPEIINKLQGMQNTTERNSIAMQIFGRGASQLAPVLGLTADEFERARREAHEMGQVLDRDALNAANKFRIEWEQLRAELGLAGRDVQQAVIPAMTGLAQSFREDIVPVIKSAAESTANVIRWWNDLDPTTRRLTTALLGAGAALGPILTTMGGILRILPQLRAAMLAFNTVGLAAMGPTGWVVLGVTAVAGLAAVLAGQGGTQLSLETAINRANTAASSATALEDLDTTLTTLASNLTGSVKTAFQGAVDDIWAIVSAAESAQEALTRIALGSNLAQMLQGDTDLKSALDSLINLDASRSWRSIIEDELVRGDFAGAAEVARRVLESYKAIGSESDIAALSRFIIALESAEQRLMALAAGRQPPPTPTPPPPPPGGTGGSQAGDLTSGAFARINPFGPIFQQYREHLDDELEREVLRFQRGLTGPRFPLATGSVFGPVFTQYEGYLEGELSREVLRFQSGLLGSSLRFTPVSDNVLGPLATEYAEFLDGETQRFLTNAWDLVSQPARRRAAERDAFNASQNARVGGAAEFDRFLAATQALTPDALTAAKAQRELAQRTAEAERQARAEAASYESLARIRYSLNTATQQGLLAERELLELRKRASFLGFGKNIAEEAVDTSGFWAEIAARRARGDKPEKIVREEDADRLRDAAVDFATTVIDAGNGFVSIVESFRSGNAAGGINAIGSTVGSLIGLVPGAGQAASIVTGVFGLVASLVGLGSNRSREEEERRRAAELRRNQVSTLEFNFYFDQTNNFTGDLTSSANQSRLREAGIMSFQQFEQTLRRTILPRLEGLEARVAAL